MALSGELFIVIGVLYDNWINNKNQTIGLLAKRSKMEQGEFDYYVMELLKRGYLKESAFYINPHPHSHPYEHVNIMDIRYADSLTQKGKEEIRIALSKGIPSKDISSY